MSQPNQTDAVSPQEPLSHAESRGIELIGAAERHGRARDLFAVWAAPSVSVLSFAVGASMILLGMELWQAFLVIIASGIPWLLTGLVAISGPAAGTSGSVITRAVYGVRGNRVVVAFYGWFISSVFLALNWLASSFMAAELLAQLGFTDPVLGPVLVTIVVAAITVLVAVFGHGLILRSYPMVAVILLAIFLLVTAFILPHVNWNYAPAESLQGVPLWSSMTVGFAILASSPLSFSNSPDMARYLPRSTKPSHIIAATALGGILPSTFFTAVGALLATGVDAAAMDLGIESALLALLPAWLGPIFVAGVIINTISLNGMTTYTASMAFQSIGIPIRRIPAAVVVGAIGTTLTIYLVMSTSLLEAVNLMLQLLILISGPTMAIFATDVIIRRNRYSGEDLFNERPGSPFWYTSGWHLPGLLAVILGGGTASLFLTSSLYTGPIAAAMGGIDLSVPVSLFVTAAAYALWTRFTRPRVNPKVADRETANA
ncbi:putative NCS1 family transporter [Arthrobacter globiformis NBRC 12137]|uniref:Putative NCS1 family transporter n=1 Tax=Arthrobacter globiformis (strain ATCC 8010 / DSM 20124 / JCM 1332 / NBRC 12137 / NCIMB 8907 / NRRL B-2979 / 168) TaxID=1077972 RepID=H0QJU5_ARTG1|nr:cytosine permease [Arthrobacter globiformis]GAB13096.1 putative NCS1 family transporter [Arthrobacter globiformis NBRC 12137]